MRNNLKSFRTDRIIFAAGAIVLGIVQLVWPSTSLLIMGKCIGAVLAAGGLAAAFMFFRNNESAMKSVLLIMAAVMLICGVVIFLHPDDLVRLIPTIMGILVLISGLINLGETFMLTRSKYNKWWASLIVAIATIAAGIFLIRNAFNLASLITRIAGGILILDGISDLWVVSRVSKAHKEMETEAAAVDVEATVTDEKPAPAGSAESEGTAQAPAENEVHQPEAGADPIQPPVQPEESSAVPEYMEQTEQDTDFSAFAGSENPQNKQDENKQAE